MNKNLGPKILELRSEGKTYQEIVNILGTNKGTVSYHCGKGQKEKTRARSTKNRNKQHPFKRKLEHFKFAITRNSVSFKAMSSFKKTIQNKIWSFCQPLTIRKKWSKNTMSAQDVTITFEDVLNKFGENPKCYLTGVEIDISKPKTYSFDHIIPASKGGPNTIDNLGICTKEANQAKSDMMLDDFVKMCKLIAKQHE
jgi:hypothetical protein